MKVKDARLPRANASIPFVTGITGSWGDEQLHQGLEQAFARAKTPEDVASGFAEVYDQTTVAIPAGVTIPRPVLDATRRVRTQVARVPKAPFATLLCLNLLYAAAGLTLAFTAMLVVHLGEGVKDAQARLSVAAVVAESFENPALGDDAVKVEDLYAERRGKLSPRIALAKGKSGGRRYRQIVVKGREEDQGLLN